jgi:hypothetical protein
MYFATRHYEAFEHLLIAQKYNPDLQRRSLENREKKQQDFDDFVGRLKQYSKSDRPSKSTSVSPTATTSHHPLSNDLPTPNVYLRMLLVWEVQKEADAAMRAQRQEDSVRIAHEVRLQQEAIKREAAAAAR